MDTRPTHPNTHTHTHTPQMLADLNAQQLSNISYGLAVLRAQPSSAYMDALLRAAARLLGRGDVPGQALGMLAYALALLRRECHVGAD